MIGLSGRGGRSGAVAGLEELDEEGLLLGLLLGGVLATETDGRLGAGVGQSRGGLPLRLHPALEGEPGIDGVSE
jgi:hypothetical protein